jgi:hypothetical protein
MRVTAARKDIGEMLVMTVLRPTTIVLVLVYLVLVLETTVWLVPLQDVRAVPKGTAEIIVQAALEGSSWTPMMERHALLAQRLELDAPLVHLMGLAARPAQLVTQVLLVQPA